MKRSVLITLSVSTLVFTSRSTMRTCTMTTLSTMLRLERLKPSSLWLFSTSARLITVNTKVIATCILLTLLPGSDLSSKLLSTRRKITVRHAEILMSTATPKKKKMKSKTKTRKTTKRTKGKMKKTTKKTTKRMTKKMIRTRTKMMKTIMMKRMKTVSVSLLSPSVTLKEATLTAIPVPPRGASMKTKRTTVMMLPSKMKML
mmetsp:Transcript_24602/g.34353  ORF Transcript_24602/g.34353 Transcript_24602/m.34353 type:complete len:202 (-) Transcript_24602:2829-3434(-)